MINFLKKNKNEIILVVVLILAAVLRFYNFADVSLSNDELSALNRTRFDNFHELIKGGVKTDAHPAGVQLFMFYWRNAFGNSPGSLRFPFVCAGILSVLFIYLLSAKWVNKTAALFSAAALCFLQYTILYSQLARPYSMGMLFVLATTFFWSNILFFSKEKPKLRDLTGFIISASLATYTHYFSSLTVVLIGISGLIFIKKNNWKQYVISGIVIGILFIPHISISLKQLGYDLGWLGKPERGWILDYVSYCFNNSTFLLIVFLVILVASVFLNYSNLYFSKFQYLAVSFFIIPFLIGYFYSIYRTPVLQYSVLIFSFPFFLIFLFSFIPKDSKSYVYAVLLLFTISGVSSTVVEKKFYSTPHFGNFKGIAENIAKWNKAYGEKNISRTINVNAPFYIHYYLDKYADTSAFLKYRFNEEKDLGELIRIVNNSNTTYFLYASSSAYNPLEIKEIIREKFPVIVEEKDYNGAEVILFKRDSLYKRKCIYFTKNDFEKQYLMWEFDSTMLDTIVFLSGKKSCILDEKNIYSAGFVSEYSNFPVKEYSCIVSVSVDAFLTKNAKAEIVFSIEKPGRENEWFGSKINNTVCEKQKWGRAFLTHILGTKYEPKDKIKIYIWNTGKDKLYIDDFCIHIYAMKKT